MVSETRLVTDFLLRAEETATLGIRFVELTGEDRFFSYQEVIGRAKTAAAAYQEAGLRPGDRVALVLATSIEFFDALLGAQLAGGIPTALYPPFRLGKLDEYYARLRRMLGKVGTRFLVTDSRIGRILGPGVEHVPSLERVIHAPELQRGGGVWRPVAADPDSPAFLQFSSGTTVEPKAVMVSHENLVCNLEMMKAALGAYTEEDQARGAVSWLPLYHDMGLVGCLYMGLYFPGNVTYLRPDLFLAKPAVWLQAISRRRAVISAAPNFAYGLCLKKVTDAEMEGVDLSSWRMALNGAEPIELRTAEQFAERFGRWGFPRTAMTPVYGLAEAGLGVSFSEVDQPPHTVEFDREALSLEDRAVPGEGRRMVSVGRPLPGLKVAIQDESGAALPEGRVGRIMVRGPSITRGYFQDPGLTATIIRNGWLDTGDLGFLHDGHLYISGRLKDLIIIRGRNYAPQEVEELLLDVPGLRTGCAVALSTMVEEEGEQLIVLGERDTIHPRPDEEVTAEINGRVLKGLSLKPHHVELLPPGTLPRTSSGKLRRSDALKQFLAGELVPPEKVTALKLLKDLGRSQLSWARFRLKR